MILLDTNIVSELMRPCPAESVTTWLDAQSPWKLAISSITIAEIGYGLAMLPTGNRKFGLESAFRLVVDTRFSGRIWSFDENAAQIYGLLMAQIKNSGRSGSIPDIQIASIAKVNGAAIATRNVKDFAGLGIELINPY